MREWMAKHARLEVNLALAGGVRQPHRPGFRIARVEEKRPTLESPRRSRVNRFDTPALSVSVLRRLQTRARKAERTDYPARHVDLRARIPTQER
jgi:hypothetical protein